MQLASPSTSPICWYSGSARSNRARAAVMIGAVVREIAQGFPCLCLLEGCAVRFDRPLGGFSQCGLGEPGRPPVLGQAVQTAGKLIDPVVCGGPFQHGGDVAGLGLQPGHGAGAATAADLASGDSGEPGVVADGLVQVGGVGRMVGGDVVADRGQGPQPVALTEGQPELPQHRRRGQPVLRQQRGQVLAADPVGKHAQQAEQPQGRGGHQRRGDRGLHRHRHRQLPAGPAHPRQHPGPLRPPPLRHLAQVRLALRGISHQLHRQRHPVQPGQQLIQPRIRREPRPGHGQEQPPRISQRQRAQHREIPPPQPRRAAGPPRGERHRSPRHRRDRPQQLLHRQRVRRPRGLEIIQHQHRQPGAQHRAHPVQCAARRPVTGHPQLGGQPRQQRPGGGGAVTADEPPPVPEPLRHPAVVQGRQADRALADPRRAQHRHRLRRHRQPRRHQRGDLSLPADQIRPRRKPARPRRHRRPSRRAGFLQRLQQQQLQLLRAGDLGQPSPRTRPAGLGTPAAGPADPGRHLAAAPAGSASPRPHPARTPAAAAPPRSRCRTPARYRTPPAGRAPASRTATRSAPRRHRSRAPCPGSNRPACSSRAVKYAMSAIASPARVTAASAAATNDRSRGNSRNSEV